MISLRKLGWLGLLSGGISMGCGAADTSEPSVGSTSDALTLGVVKGTRPVLLILRQKDAATPLIESSAAYRKRFFGPGFPDVADYFDTISNKKFAIKEAGTVSVIDHSDAAFDKRAGADLIPGDKNVLQRSRLRALMEADDAGFDFDAFDKNGDGTVSADELMVISVENTSDTSAQTGWPPCVKHPSGVKVCTGVTVIGHKSNVLNFAHELTHQLGPLDVYGTSCLSFDLSLMSCTRESAVDPVYYLDPWYRGKLGWLHQDHQGASAGSVTLLSASHDGGGSRLALHRDGNDEELDFELREDDGYDANVRTPGVHAWYADTAQNGYPRAITGVTGTGVDQALFNLAPTGCYGDPNNVQSRGASGALTPGASYRFRWADSSDTGWLVSIGPIKNHAVTITWETTKGEPTCAQASQYRVLFNEGSTKCADFDPTNDLLRQAACDSGDRQQWQVIDNGQIRNRVGGQCMAADEATGNVANTLCDSRQASQLWDIEADGRIHNRATKKCLAVDVHNGITADKANILETTCSSAATQVWALATPVPPKQPPTQCKEGDVQTSPCPAGFSGASVRECINGEWATTSSCHKGGGAAP